MHPLIIIGIVYAIGAWLIYTFIPRNWGKDAEGLILAWPITLPASIIVMFIVGLIWLSDKINEKIYEKKV